MALPVSEGYPVVFENPEVIRAAAILPALGAWDAAPLEINVTGARNVVFYMSYTAGAPNGAVDFYFEYSPMSQDPLAPPMWWRDILFAPGILAAGVDTQSRIQRQYVTYQAVGLVREDFRYPPDGPIDLGLCVERIRLFARESGAAGNPGVFGVGAYLMRGA